MMNGRNIGSEGIILVAMKEIEIQLIQEISLIL